MNRTYEPKNTGDFRCVGCGTWGMGNQHWQGSGSKGPYCDDCIVRENWNPDPTPEQIAMGEAEMPKEAYHSRCCCEWCLACVGMIKDLRARLFAQKAHYESFDYIGKWIARCGTTEAELDEARALIAECRAWLWESGPRPLITKIDKAIACPGCRNRSTETAAHTCVPKED